MSTSTTSPDLVCPHCVPSPAGGEGALSALTSEVARIRALAESPVIADYERRIAELTAEVTQLRATVARLRATAPV